MKPDVFKRISREIDSKTAKTKRLLSLDARNFAALQDYCRRKDVSVSELVDKLIASYLEHVTAEIPPPT